MYKFIFIISLIICIPGIIYNGFLMKMPAKEREIETLKKEIENQKKELNGKIVLYENSIDLEKIEKEMNSKYKMKIAKNLEQYEIED